MKDALNRAARSFMQGFIGSLVLANLASAADTSGVVNWGEGRKIVSAAVVAGATAVVSWAHNALENKGIVKPVLKG